MEEAGEKKNNLIWGEGFSEDCQGQVIANLSCSSKGGWQSHGEGIRGQREAFPVRGNGISKGKEKQIWKGFPNISVSCNID